MGAMASQITSLTIVYWIVYSDADQRKYQSPASLVFVLGIHRGPVNSPHKWPVTRKMFPFDDVIMNKVRQDILWDFLSTLNSGLSFMDLFQPFLAQKSACISNVLLLLFLRKRVELRGELLHMCHTQVNMMTSSNGNIFRVTGHLCGEFPGLRWIPRTKASDAELLYCFWSVSE